jgi:hypothetical protein
MGGRPIFGGNGLRKSWAELMSTTQNTRPVARATPRPALIEKSFIEVPFENPTPPSHSSDRLPQTFPAIVEKQRF